MNGRPNRLRRSPSGERFPQRHIPRRGSADDIRNDRTQMNHVPLNWAKENLRQNRRVTTAPPPTRPPPQHLSDRIRTRIVANVPAWESTDADAMFDTYFEEIRTYGYTLKDRLGGGAFGVAFLAVCGKNISEDEAFLKRAIKFGILGPVVKQQGEPLRHPREPRIKLLLGQAVVIKIFRETEMKESLKEAKIMCRIAHPYITRILDLFFLHKGSAPRLALVVEWGEYGSLLDFKQKVEKHGIKLRRLRMPENAGAPRPPNFRSTSRMRGSYVSSEFARPHVLKRRRNMQEEREQVQQSVYRKYDYKNSLMF